MPRSLSQNGKDHILFVKTCGSDYYLISWPNSEGYLAPVMQIGSSCIIFNIKPSMHSLCLTLPSKYIQDNIRCDVFDYCCSKEKNGEWKYGSKDSLVIEIYFNCSLFSSTSKVIKVHKGNVKEKLHNSWNKPIIRSSRVQQYELTRLS